MSSTSYLYSCGYLARCGSVSNSMLYPEMHSSIFLSDVIVCQASKQSLVLPALKPQCLGTSLVLTFVSVVISCTGETIRLSPSLFDVEQGDWCILALGRIAHVRRTRDAHFFLKKDCPRMVF